MNITVYNIFWKGQDLPVLLVLEAELGLRMDPVRRTDDAPLEEAEERPPSTESSSSMFLSIKEFMHIINFTFLN